MPILFDSVGSGRLKPGLSSLSDAPPIRGLVGYYRADRGVKLGNSTSAIGTVEYGNIPSFPSVTRWADQSGFGNDLTNATDTAAGNPGLSTVAGFKRIEFTTVGQTLSFPSGMSFNNRSLSMFAVIRSEENLTSSTSARRFFQAGAAGLTASLDYNNGYLRFSDNAQKLSTMRPGRAEQLVGFTCGAASDTTKAQLYQGGEVATVALGTAGVDSGGQLGLGSPYGYVGGILAMLVYNTSNPDVEGIRAWAQKNYGCGATAAQVAANAVPFFYADGDSQMAGYIGGGINDPRDNMLHKLSRMGRTGAPYMNFANSGDTILGRKNSSTAGSVTALGVNISVARTSPKILVLDMGTNSINPSIPSAGGNQDGATTVTDMKNYLDLWASNVAKVFVVPVRPLNTGTYETRRTDYNSGCATLCGTYSNVVWLGSALNHPAWTVGASTDSIFYQGDGLHFNDNGWLTTATLLAQAIGAAGFVNYQ